MCVFRWITVNRVHLLEQFRTAVLLQLLVKFSLCTVYGDSYLQFDGDDHRREVFIQLLQHDQLLQSQVEQPVRKHKQDFD